MFRTQIKIAFRRLWRYKFHSLLNIFGLALGIFCTSVIYFFVTYHRGFNHGFDNSEQIYRIVTDMHLPDGNMEYAPGTPFALNATWPTEDNLTTQHTALLSKLSFNIEVPEKGQTDSRLFSEKENVALADENFFKVFHYKRRKGADLETALRDPKSVVLTESVAEKFFGPNDPIGQSLIFDNKHVLRVAAVVEDLKDPSDISSTIFVSFLAYKDFYPSVEQQFKSDWTFINSKLHTFIVVPRKSALPFIEQRLAAATKQNFGDLASAYHFSLQPLTEMHLDTRYDGAISEQTVNILSLVGLLILIISCVNFLNLIAAQIASRGKEIGIMNVLGSRVYQTFMKFTSEMGIYVLFAYVIAMGGVLLVMPYFNHLFETAIPIHALRLLEFSVLLIVFLSIACSLYPTYVAGKYAVVNILKDSKLVGSSIAAKITRKIVMVFQNLATQVFITCALIMGLQLNFVRDADLGFNKNSIIVVPLPDSQFLNERYFQTKLLGIPGVSNSSLCSRPPTDNSLNGGQVRLDGKDWEDFTARTIIGDSNYVPTFGLQLVAGHNISGADTLREVLINKALMHKLGFQDPEKIIGHRLILGDLNEKEGVISGVVNDFNVRSLDYPREPTLIAMDRNLCKYLAIKIRETYPEPVIETIQHQWKRQFPKNIFEYTFLSDKIQQLYRKETVLNQLISISSLVAILISVLGLLGLISIESVRRAKEMAIRKVLGASVVQIMRSFFNDILIFNLVAALVSFPIAFLVMSNWLDHFAYRIHLALWMFLISLLAALWIAFITMFAQTFKVASASPVKNLRGT